MSEGTNDHSAREWAKLLYTRHNKSVRDIALETTINEGSIHNWMREGGWEGIRNSLLVSKDTQLKRLYSIVDRLSAKMDEDGHETNAKDIDLFIKYATAIKTLEGDVTPCEIVDVAGLFINWLRTTDLQLAQKITPHFDTFIKQKLLPLSS